MLDPLVWPVAINAYGWWVGSVTDSVRGAVLRTPTTDVRLVGQQGPAVEAPSHVTRAVTISDDGRTLAGETPDERNVDKGHAAVWRCT